jgi:hypothetical protein
VLNDRINRIMREMLQLNYFVITMITCSSVLQPLPQTNSGWHFDLNSCWACPVALEMKQVERLNGQFLGFKLSVLAVSQAKRP